MAIALTTDRSSTFTERDVRKGVIDMIAMDTPVTSTLVKKGPKPLETTPEWELKTYGSPSKSGTIEGATPSFSNNLANKYMLKGRFIKQSRNVAVTKEMQLLGNQYNRPDALADNIKDGITQLYVDVEFASLSDDEAVAPVASTTASEGRGIARWISNANGRFTDTDTTPTSAARTPTGSILVSKTNASDITEAEIAGLITSVATTRKKAGMRMMGVCTPLMRDEFDGYSRTDKSYTSSAFPVSRFAQKQGTIDREVTFYKSSNGTVELLTSFQMDTTAHFLLLSPDMIELRYAQSVLVNPDHSTSAQVKEREIDVIYVLECLNPQAHGKAITGATA